MSEEQTTSTDKKNTEIKRGTGTVKFSNKINKGRIIKDDEGCLWYRIPLAKRFQLAFKKGIIVIKDIPILDDATEGFDFRSLNRLTLFNNEIVTFLYSNGTDFAIYDSLEGGDLIISATDELLEVLNDSVADIITMKAQLSSRDGRSFHTKIAGAMRLCLMGMGKQAAEIFSDTALKIQQSRKNMFRLLYLSGATTVMVLLSIFTLLLRSDALGDFQWNVDKLLNIMLFASIGGMFSVLRGYKSIKAEIPEAGRFNYYINGVSRIIISLLAGIVAYELLMADFIMTNLKDNPYVMNCLSIMSGFTEGFIPGVLKKTTKELESDPD